MDVPSLWRQVRRVADRVNIHARRLVALEAKTSRRATVILTDLAVGLTPVPIVWDTPLPAPDYTPVVTVNGSDNAITVLRCGLAPGTRTVEGCTIRVNNTGAVTIATVGLEVVAIRA